MHSTTVEGLEVPDYSPSKPVSETEDDIGILRRLDGLTDKGILAGKVVRIGATTDELNPTAVPNHKVVAKSWPFGTEYTAFTKVNGRFEFELPHGSYDVTAAREQDSATPSPGYLKTSKSTPAWLYILVMRMFDDVTAPKLIFRSW